MAVAQPQTSPARQRRRHQARRAGQLVPQEQPLAAAVRHRLLRHRVHGHRRQQVRHRPLRRGGDAVQPAAGRPADRRRPRGDEDAARAAAHLAADARAEVVHLDGGLRLDGRRVRQLRRRAGHRPLHSRRYLYSRLPAAARASDSSGHRPARQDSARRDDSTAPSSRRPRASRRSERWWSCRCMGASRSRPRHRADHDPEANRNDRCLPTPPPSTP